MPNPSKADISFDEVTISVKDKSLHLSFRPLVQCDNNISEHWAVRARLSGGLKKPRITIAEPQSKGKRAFLKEIVRDVLRDATVKKVLGVTSKLKLPDSVEASFTVNEHVEWQFTVDIEYLPPVYTRIKSQADDPEDA